MLTLLAEGAVPRDMVRAEDFSDGLARRMAQWLLDGGSANALVAQIEDDAQRDQAVRALNYAPIPEERDGALKLVQTCLRTIRRGRLSERAANIQKEIQTAGAEQKRALYQQMEAINRELDG